MINCVKCLFETYKNYTGKHSFIHIVLNPICYISYYMVWKVFLCKVVL